MADSTKTVQMTVKMTDEASSVLKGLFGTLDDFSRKLTGLSLTQFTTVAGLATLAAEGFKTMVAQSSELEDATFRLNNTYAAFGNTLGISRQKLTDFANEASRNSRFSEASITEMQQTLMKFGTITGDTFERAQKVTLDLGAQMKDLGGAAYIVGRSLSAPEQSTRLLLQAGVKLDENQKEQIKNFEKLGDKASAMGIILGELEKRTNNVAAKDINTFSGAWAQLKNTFDNLFESKDHLQTLTVMIKGLNQAVTEFTEADPIKRLENQIKHLKEEGLTDSSRQVKALRDEINKLKEDAKGPLLGEQFPGATMNLAPADKVIDPDYAKKLEELTNGWNQLYNQITKTTDEMHTAAATEEARKEAEALAKSLELWDQSLQDVAQSQEEVLKGFDDVTKGMNKDIEESIKSASEAATKGLTAESKNAELVHENMVRGLQNVFANFFANTKGGFRGLLESFTQMVRQMIAEALAAQLTKALLGSSSGGGGGFWGAVVGGVTAAFGSGGGSGGLTEFGAGDLSALSPHASGGLSSGGLSLVGEEGPEIMASGPARFFNARQLAFAGGSGTNFAPVTNIIMQPKDGDVGSLRQEFYAAIDMNNKKQKSEMYNTMYRNGLGRMR